MPRYKASRVNRRAIRKVKRVLAEAGKRGQLRPVAFERGEPIGWVGEMSPDECPCCLLLAQEEESPRPGTRPRFYRRCGQTIWLHPEELRRKKNPLCYRCFMGLPAGSRRPTGVVH